MIEKYPQIRITFSLSGIVLEQLETFAPEVLESFKRLADTGAVEFLSETYYHSLASLVKSEEFEAQVLKHAEAIYHHFGQRPRVFRNTELIYNDEIGKRVAMLGFQGIFTEGHESFLGENNPHFLYKHPDDEQLKIFLRHYRLSDDIGFRFMQGSTRLTINQYMNWLNRMPREEQLTNLAMDYETFGEHQKADSGIFNFLEDMLENLAISDRFSMILPSETLVSHTATSALSIPGEVSWADTERNLSAWLGNDMQKDAFNSVMKLEKDVRALGDEELLQYWRYLQTSDHFYYMCVKSDLDGSVHKYFNPFPSSYEAFINYMNVLTHFTYRLNERKNKTVTNGKDLSSTEAERQNLPVTTPVWVMNLESVPQGNVS
jgi:alpha-amylase